MTRGQVDDVSTLLRDTQARIKATKALLHEQAERKKRAYNPLWRDGYERDSDRYDYFAAKALCTAYKAELLYLNTLSQELTDQLVESLSSERSPHVPSS